MRTRALVLFALSSLVAMPALAWFLKEYDLGRSVVLLVWGLLTIHLYVSRSLLRMAKQHLIRRGIGLTRVLICGTGDTGRRVAASIRDHPEVGYDLVGFIDGVEPPCQPRQWK